MILRCYAEGIGHRWEAVCLDFDLSVQGKSFEDVRRQLRESVIAYIDYVKELPADEQGQFLSRKAPLGLRLKFAWHAFVDAIKRPIKSDIVRAEFGIPRPA